MQWISKRRQCLWEILKTARKTKTTFTENNFCCVIACYLQLSCYIMADVAEEALMASHVSSQMCKSFSLWAPIHPPNCSHSCFCCCLNRAVCNLEAVVFGSLAKPPVTEMAKQDPSPCLTTQWLNLINADCFCWSGFSWSISHSRGKVFLKSFPSLKTLNYCNLLLPEYSYQGFDDSVDISMNTKDWLHRTFFLTFTE